MTKKIVLVASIIFLAGCRSVFPVVPEASDIKVVREEPSKECENLGMIEGRTNKVHDKIESVVEDLKQEAIKKGAHVVKVETTGAQGSAMRGTAYYCK